MALRTIPIRRAGNRDNLFLGGDRELVMFTGALSLTLMFGVQDRVAFVGGILFWTVGLYLWRLMAKHDPRQRDIWLKQRSYQHFYAPRSSPFRSNDDAQARRYR